MIDHFALLQQIRQPWLNPDALKQKYQELSQRLHPDQQSHRANRDDVATDFAAINEAYRILSNPKLRLQHLLTLEGRAPISHQPVPKEFAELFGETGSLVQELDLLITKLKTSNGLTKSLLRSEIVTKQKRGGDLATKLKKEYQACLEELANLNQEWNNRSDEVLAQIERLYYKISFLMKWIGHLDERQFQLSL